MSKMATLIRKTGVAAALVVASAASSAGALFAVDPTFTGTDPGLNADRLAGVGLTRATLSANFGSLAGTVTGNGLNLYTSATLGGIPQLPMTSNFTPINLWSEFSFTLTLTSGGLGNQNSSYVISNLAVTFYGEIRGNGDTTFNAGDVNTNPSFVASADTFTLATAFANPMIVPGTGGVAEINNLGGSSFSPVAIFSLTADGSKFFVDPDPFHNLIFASFTNVITEITRDIADREMYLSTEGGVTFATVPEPSALALVGLSLLIGGLSVRRSRGKRDAV